MEGFDLLGALALNALHVPSLSVHPAAVTLPHALTPPHAITPAAAASAAMHVITPRPVVKAISKAATTVVSPSVAKAQRQLDASKRALTVASRLTGRLAPHGAKLAAKANRAMTSAQRILSAAAAHRAMGAMQSGTTKYGGGSAGAGGGGGSAGSTAPAPSGATAQAAPPTDDSGVDINVLNAVSQVVSTANMMQVVLDALSAGGDIQAALAAEAKAAHSAMGYLIGAKYATAIGFAIADVVSQGQALIQRAVDVVDNYDPAAPDQSIPATVAAINKDATAWNSAIRQLVASTPTATVAPGSGAAAGAPTITSIVDQNTGTPSSGAPGDTVMITGTNFTGVSAVLFGGVPAVPFQVISPTQMTALVPQAAVTGTVQVMSPAGVATSVSPFTVLPAAQTPPYGGGGGGGGGFDGGGGGGGGFDGGGMDDGGGYDDGSGDGYDDSGDAGDDSYDETGMPTDPGNVMQDPYGAYEDNYGVDGGGNEDATDDGSGDGSADDGSGGDDQLDEDSEDADIYSNPFALMGHSNGHGHNGRNGHHSGARGAWYTGPADEVDGLELIDAVDVDDKDRDDVINDIVEQVTKRLQDKSLIGAYDIQSAQRQMNTLKQVTVAIARAMVRGGQKVAATTIATAQGGFFQKELPGVTSLKNTQGHLQWHADALAKLSDPTAIYASSDDVKKWCMQAFIDANAVEEGRAEQEQIWGDMWTEIGAELAKLPKEIVQTIAKLPGNVFEAVTGIPSWIFWVGGAAVFVLLGVGAWKLLKIATPIATHVAVARYLP